MLFTGWGLHTHKGELSVSFHKSKQNELRLYEQEAETCMPSLRTLQLMHRATKQASLEVQVTRIEALQRKP